MPQSSQIIPEYRHPHVMTVINDNTEFQETVAVPETGLHGLFIFTSGKGRDNVLLNKGSRPEYIEEYGRPNFLRYGQPGYMPYNFLGTGAAKAWCMRIMPDDATYANSVVVAKVKVVQSEDPTPVPSLLVYFQIQSHTGVSERGELIPLSEILADEDPDSDGFMSFPLFVISSAGRGVYGDSTRYRVVPAVQADKENDFKNYRFEIYELENTLRRKELFESALFYEAAVGTQSIFVEDMVNDMDTGSGRINITTFQESFQKIFDIYKTDIDPATELTIETFDPIYGRNKSGVAIPGIQFDLLNPDHISLDNPSAIPLGGGSDGSFEYGAADPSVREDAIIESYQKAYSGELDRAVLSKRRSPSQIILDAGHSEEVKTEIIKLAIRRYDAYTIIDGGILNTVSDAVEWGESMKGMSDRIFSKECQHYKTRDPFNGKIIPVTITYFYASMLPIHFSTPGNQTPFVGERFAKLTGHIKNSLLPVIDADDKDNKEALYDLRINYFQTIKENTFVRGTQTTSQNIWSDLSEENNMWVLLDLKREIEDMVNGLSYNLAEAEDRIAFKEHANRIINPYRGSKLREATVEFNMNPWEEERSILHCYLGVTFRTMGKRAIIEIDVNRRIS